MKPLPAAAFSLIALLAGSGAFAQTTPPPEEPKPAPAAPAAPAEEPKYGTFALDANGNKITGDALAKLSPEARWAMETKGYSPVLGPNGEVLGYDDGKQCILPDAVGKDYAAAAEKAKLGPGVQGPCPPNFPDCQSKEPAQPPPPTESDPIGAIPAEPGANHCDQPGPPPPCAPRVETPEQVAERERQEAEKKNNEKIASATQSGDVNSLAEAYDERNKARQNDGSNKTAYNDGTEDASAGPGPSGIGSTGGQSLGQEGRVGGSGGLKGREVTPDSRALAQSVIDMNNGMANGDLGPGDPNVQSTAQLAQRGLSGRAFDAAKQLFATLSENLGVAADSPDTDLSDQLATNPIDGGRGNQAPIKVSECDSTRHDTLGTKGRNVRKAGGC